MRNFRIVLGLGLAFAAGCVAASHPFVVPPARAATVQRWEYTYFDETSTNDARAKLNQAGREGWELTEVVGSAWFMKRPIP